VRIGRRREAKPSPSDAARTRGTALATIGLALVLALLTATCTWVAWDASRSSVLATHELRIASAQEAVLEAVFAEHASQLRYLECPLAFDPEACARQERRTYDEARRRLGVALQQVEATGDRPDRAGAAYVTLLERRYDLTVQRQFAAIDDARGLEARRLERDTTGPEIEQVLQLVRRAAETHRARAAAGIGHLGDRTKHSAELIPVVFGLAFLLLGGCWAVLLSLQRRLHRQTRELSREKVLLDGVLSAIPHLVYWKDAEGRYQGMNTAFVEQRQAAPESDELSAVLTELERAVVRTGDAVLDHPAKATGADGRGRQLLVSVIPRPGVEGATEGVIGIGSDVTRVHELRDELTHQASHDTLTGLPNRAETLRHLSAALAAPQGPGQHTGLLFVDLDGFKAINDTHGHAAGDQLLCEVARRMAAALRPDDAVGRLGGDEFVVTVQGVRAVGNLVGLGQRLIAAVSTPIQVRTDGDKAIGVAVGASVGVSMSSQGSTPDALLAEADLAAYRAKRHGRGRVEVFDDGLRAELAERAELEAALRKAVADGELTLHYQPVVNLATGALAGYEALARWTRPGIGPVSPEVFIAAAEASSLVRDLGRWVLAEATTQVARWRDAGLAGFSGDGPEPTIAVNLSGRHLSDARVLTDVSEALAASGLPPTLLVLEITETVLVNDPQATRHLQELRAHGIRVAIDDFGTGFTSIGALSTTPADILKIDRAFVSSDDPGHHQLSALITRAAHTFSLRVVAEGVETPDQLARVRSDGCNEAQGYLFSRPLLPESVENLSYPLSGLYVHERTA
jgi:diguanylate cyclase (GGDEF)-like protein